MTQQQAQIVIKQLGGIGKLKAMTSAYDLMYSADGFTFKFKGSKKVNFCRISLNWRDEYDVTFSKVTMKDYLPKEDVKVETEAHAGNLKQVFESETGLYLSI